MRSPSDPRGGTVSGVRGVSGVNGVSEAKASVSGDVGLRMALAVSSGCRTEKAGMACRALGMESEEMAEVAAKEREGSDVSLLVDRGMSGG